jgi:hypothetical protein
LLPLLATFNPRAVETLARTAGLLRAQADALERQGETLLLEAGRDALLKAEAKRAADAARVRRGITADEKDAHADVPGALADARDARADARDARADARDARADVRDARAADSAPPLSVEVLRAADGAVLSYALRGWIKSGRGNLRRIEATHIEAVAGLLEGSRGGRVAELPGGAWVERRRGLLLFYAGERRAGKS